MQFTQTLLGSTYAHPLITAAGMWAWTAENWKGAVLGGAAGITTKSFWNHEHVGNPDPVVAQGDAWTINAVGLPDHGPEHSERELQSFLPSSPVPVIVSILGLTPEEYADNAARTAPLKPAALEVNLSSPTFVKLKGAGYAVDEAIAIVPEVKKHAHGIPLFVKLSPNIPDIGSFAARCVEAGADGITAINTLSTGLAIDLATRRPILSAKKGGLSGPGMKPFAVRCVRDIYEATNGKVPIIGIGGVMTGEDVVEMLLAGASLVGLASAIVREGFGCFGRIRGELEAWCEQEGVKDIRKLVGAMIS